MKKTLTILTLSIAVLTLVGFALGRPAHVGMSLSTETRKAMAQGDSAQGGSTQTEVDMKLHEELKYYLDRHNVQDEGYEMVVAFANGKRHQVDIDPQLTAWNIGTWASHQHTDGTGVALDSSGRTIIGTYEGDSLRTGIRLDSLGTYVGDFYHLEASGHGAYILTDDSYAEGHWEQDLQHGFGLQLLTNEDGEPSLRVGEWSSGKFQGERMKYTTERIYGIDIARYQHGKGRKKYPIQWNQLRITHVGKKGSQNVSGVADYPVSFVYIKSTEGTSIRNKYYLNDYAKARKQGIRVGAYHFFSVRTSGAAQAQHFIRNTLFRSGDLPPVLDIEPSNAQIQQMGGAEKMFQHIRAWLKAVEHRTGVRPILYVNQMFINRYLPLAPDLKRDYRVWIARYSEYKPDVRLTYWQLCPDGRVKGIHGEVDINVFNGYKSQFEEFLEEETIK